MTTKYHVYGLLQKSVQGGVSCGQNLINFFLSSSFKSLPQNLTVEDVCIKQEDNGKFYLDSLSGFNIHSTTKKEIELYDKTESEIPIHLLKEYEIKGKSYPILKTSKKEREAVINIYTNYVINDEIIVVENQESIDELEKIYSIIEKYESIVFRLNNNTILVSKNCERKHYLRTINKLTASKSIKDKIKLLKARRSPFRPEPFEFDYSVYGIYQTSEGSYKLID